MDKVAERVLNMSQTAPDNNEYKERLIANVKKDVKHVMEEAVTRKYIHEDSGSVTALCSSVESCLSQGLRRRALGLFKSSSTTALLHKVAKHCPEAATISQRVLDLENSDPGKRSSSSSDSIIKPPLLSKKSSSSSVIEGNKSASTTSSSISSTCASPTVKYLWIRLALYDKKLSRIIDHLVVNATRYYERDALVADPDYGSILSSLLVGPCALDYTRSKTTDHFWTDPPADELLQRHRISSSNPTPPAARRPMANYKRGLHTSSDDVSNGSFKSVSSPSASAAKDYVESLHQNSRATLLYGKNNIIVMPKDVTEPMPGYLSLHQMTNSLTVKWTPNQLMNGYNESDLIDKSSNYWGYALNINVDEIVYVHCHQTSGTDSGGTIVFVGQDGVQRSPIHFPQGGHMASFLSCMETGLLPHGQLDPPLWSQRGMGKIFPILNKSRRRPLPSLREASGEDIPIERDYVFRVVNKSNHEEFLATHPIMEVERSNSPRRRQQLSSSSTNGSSDCSMKSMSIDNGASNGGGGASGGGGDGNAGEAGTKEVNQSACIALVCSSMRRQIISRAFYGWLAYCRHLSTVRTHLSGLVHGRITPDLGANEGLTKSVWEELHVDGVVADETEVFRLVYFGGVAPELRKEVWPYLLGHYSFGSTQEQRDELDLNTHNYYETTMSEWLAVEAIVRQRDKEKTAHAVAKLSSESASGDKTKGVHMDCEMENDVFETNGISDISDAEGYDEDNATELTEKEKRSQAKEGAEKREKRERESCEVATVTVSTPKDEEDEKMELDKEKSGTNVSTPSTSSYETVGNEFNADMDPSLIPSPMENNNCHAVIVTKASIDIVNALDFDGIVPDAEQLPPLTEEQGGSVDGNSMAVPLDALQEPKSNCVSPASSNGGVYSSDLLELFGLNLHRIEKDVNRCDRNYYYFSNENVANLDKLRNIISTYVWEHLEVGYMQGMCDLLAPILVIFDDESISYGCFCKLMERMIENFPNGDAMDMHFANMRSLIQILDSEMYDLMHAHGDYTHFYFCYRWFLLDFKRELVYADVFSAWECIWAAKHVASGHFVLFLALALLETYRDIIIVNSMDFTDVIKFFNEMAERHKAKDVLALARNLVLQLQTIIENK